MKIKHVFFLVIFAGFILSACGAKSAATALDITKAALTLEDVPQGFVQLSADQLNAMNLTQESVSESFASSFKDAKLASFNVFTNQDSVNPAMVFSLVFYPLSQDEINKWSDDLKNPATLSETIGAGLGADITLDDQFSQIGDGSAGFKTNAQGYNLGLVMARRSNAAFLIMTMAAQIDAVDTLAIAKKMDARMVEGFK